MSSTEERRALPGGAKNSQRNLGLLVASGDLTLFANSTAKSKKGVGGGEGREGEE